MFYVSSYLAFLFVLFSRKIPNFIFYVFVKSIVHQSYYQSIGSIYTSVNLKGNQLNWVNELFSSRNTKTFDEKTKTNPKTPAQLISIH